MRREWDGLLHLDSASMEDMECKSAGMGLSDFLKGGVMHYLGDDFGENTTVPRELLVRLIFGSAAVFRNYFESEVCHDCLEFCEKTNNCSI